MKEEFLQYAFYAALAYVGWKVLQTVMAPTPGSKHPNGAPVVPGQERV